MFEIFFCDGLDHFSASFALSAGHLAFGIGMPPVVEIVHRSVATSDSPVARRQVQCLVATSYVPAWVNSLCHCLELVNSCSRAKILDGGF